MATIRALSFDVGWTLAYPQASIWDIFADLCTQAGAPTAPESCEQLVRALWSAGAEHAEQRFHAGASYSDSDEEFAGLFGQMGQLVFAQMGVAAGHPELIERFLQTFWNEDNWTVFPEVSDVLRDLRARGLRIGVLSNAPSNLPSFLERLGVAPYLDFVVVSAIEGVKKPDRRIFEVTLSRAGVAPQETLHVGDMYLEDIVGGRAAGINTLLMERGKRALFPNYRESEGRDLDPGTVISDLAEVLVRLEQSAALGVCPSNGENQETFEQKAFDARR
jgi:putative hydrolase of the HAD superfamily